MPKLICTNESCEYQTYVPSVTMSKNGISEKCAVCGSNMMVEVEPIQSVAYDRFASLSDTEKKRVIKQRAQTHFNEFDKKIVEAKRKEAIENMRNLIKDEDI